MAVQRFRQGIQALLAFATPVEIDLAAQYLSTKEMELFKQLGRSEQLHSLNVLRSVLQQAPETPHVLAVAALMHDIGKTRYLLTVWQKTLVVLVKHFLPVVSMRLNASEELGFWTAPFVVGRWHPKWSGELLAEVGSSEGVIWLALHHADDVDEWHEHPCYDLLLRLQAADDEN